MPAAASTAAAPAHAVHRPVQAAAAGQRSPRAIARPQPDPRCRVVAAQVRCNSGGPRSRTRTQRIRATLLGADAGQLSCPLVISVALDFGRHDPLQTVNALLRRARILEPEALRGRFAVPAEPCICREWPKPVPLRVAEASAAEVLAQVLLLGLCTQHHFDPRRPVLLTRASLTRQLQLFSGRGFYA
jgi:hypothetical protein